MRLLESVMNRIILAKMARGGRTSLRVIEENSKKPRTSNQDLLFRLLKDNADTEYGRKYGFGQIATVEEFKERVPFSTYDDYAPYIERMINNDEKNLITVYPIEHYAVSSGSVGVPKRIPVSRETLDHYNRNSSSRFFAHADEAYRATHGGKALRGKGLNTMEVSVRTTKNNVPMGAISGASVAEFRSFLPYVFTSPEDVIFPEEQMDMKYLKLRYALAEREVTFMMSAFMTGLVDLMNYLVANWPLLVEDIRAGAINADIKLSPGMRAKLEAGLRPDPARADELQRLPQRVHEHHLRVRRPRGRHERQRQVRDGAELDRLDGAAVLAARRQFCPRGLQGHEPAAALPRAAASRGQHLQPRQGHSALPDGARQRD